MHTGTPSANKLYVSSRLALLNIKPTYSISWPPQRISKRQPLYNNFRHMLHVIGNILAKISVKIYIMFEASYTK